MSVFISYRRDGGKVVAEKIFEKLSEEYNVFLDSESLSSGLFDEAIEEQVQSCIDFVLIVTQTTFDRCVEPDDWILNEVSLALSNDKNIIPIFVGVDKFPENVPVSLQKICRFNGIIWAGNSSIKKLQGFLKSNHRYLLVIDYFNEKPVLTDCSCEQLKYLQQRFNKNGRLPVDIDLKINDVDKMSEQLVRKDVLGSYGSEYAIKFAKQSLLKRFQWYKNTLICAIEFLLQDEMLDACAMRVRKMYIERYGIKNCYYVDDFGIEREYWTAFLWIDIIEEMLKEISLESGRDYYYGNTRKKYTEVDLFVENRRGNEIWHFTSYIEINPESKEYVELSKLFATYSCGDFLDIPVNDLALRIYPDLYFSIGSMKADTDQTKYMRLCEYKGIFNLANYYIGLH